MKKILVTRRLLRSCEDKAKEIFDYRKLNIDSNKNSLILATKESAFDKSSKIKELSKPYGGLGISIFRSIAFFLVGSYGMGGGAALMETGGAAFLSSR